MNSQYDTDSITLVGSNRHNNDYRFLVTPKFVSCIIVIDSSDMLEKGEWKCSIVNPHNEPNRTLAEVFGDTSGSFDYMQPGIAAKAIVLVNQVYTYHDERNILVNGALLGVIVDPLVERLLGEKWINDIMFNLWPAVDKIIHDTYATTLNDIFDKEAIEAALKSQSQAAE